MRSFASTFFALFFLSSSVQAQELQRWTFDTEADIPSEEGFTWSEEGDLISIDSTIYVDGGGSIRIDCAGSYCGLWFEFKDVEPLRGGVVVLSVDVKTEYEGTDRPAYLKIRTDSDTEKRLDSAISDRKSRVYGKTDWTNMSVMLPISDEATVIGITVESDGIGTAWFDNLTLTATSWTKSDAILSAISDLWTGRWYDWLKVLMAYAALPLALLFAASRSKRKETVTGVPWSLRLLGLSLLPLTVTLGMGLFDFLPLSGGAIIKAGDRTNQIIHASVFGGAFTFLWWRIRDQIDEVQLWRNIRLIIRFFLTGVFIVYSFSKFHGSQFGPIPESQLDTRLGDLTSMRLLWLYFGHSFAYVLFVGVSQAAGALLLTFRRTATLGAMVLFVVVSNIVFVNYAYDIGVKMPAGVYLVMTIFLLLEEFPRLWNTIVMKRTELPPPVSYRPAFSPRIGIPISIIVVLYFAWWKNIDVKESVESNAISEWLPFGGVWVVDEPGEAVSGTTWDRLVVQSSGYGTVGVGTKIGDEYSQLETVSYSDSLRTFSMTWKDSTDTFSGRYSVDGDTLRLSGIQFGDTLNVKLIRRRFRLEPDRY